MRNLSEGGHWIGRWFSTRESESCPEVLLEAITTPSGVFQPEFVVHCLAEFLLAAEITFVGLNRCVSKQELNLLEFSAR